MCILKIRSIHPPYGRRYTFLRVRKRNRRFLPHPQKNWSPLPAACTDLYINYSVYIIVNIHVRVVAGGSVNPPAHFCVYRIYIITNNVLPIKYIPNNLSQISTPTPRRYLRGIFDEKRLVRDFFGARRFWREDIVVPFVTTYAIPLRPAFATSYIFKNSIA